MPPGAGSPDYPWGNEMEKTNAIQNINGETTAVNAYPEGDLPFGCLDMCGNTWELTGKDTVTEEQDSSC